MARDVEPRVNEQRRPRDPEGRMSLGEHLTELRNRLVISAVSIFLLAIVGWFLFPWVFEGLQQPFQRAAAQGLQADINFQGVGTGLSVRLQMSAYLGLILAAPMVMFQGWMFIMPGLRKNERRYAVGFFSAAVPLFFVGCAAGYWVINQAVPILLEFTPIGEQVTQIINYADYLNLLIKTVLAFGIAFMMPVILVLLNFLGLLRAGSMIKAWRWVVFLCFAFTAVMVPTPDPFTMTFMALPMIALFFAAVGISYWNDRRRDRAAGLGDLTDDQASTIDDEVEEIERPPSAIDETDRT